MNQSILGADLAEIICIKRTPSAVNMGSIYLMTLFALFNQLVAFFDCFFNGTHVHKS